MTAELFRATPCLISMLDYRSIITIGGLSKRKKLKIKKVRRKTLQIKKVISLSETQSPILDMSMSTNNPYEYYSWICLTLIIFCEIIQGNHPSIIFTKIIQIFFMFQFFFNNVGSCYVIWTILKLHSDWCSHYFLFYYWISTSVDLQLIILRRLAKL